MKVTRHNLTQAALLVGAVPVAVFSEAHPAQACSSLPCSGGQTMPMDGAAVPASLEALRWFPRQDWEQEEPDGSSVRVVRLTNGGEVPVTVDLISEGPSYLVTPSEPWVADAEYRFEADSLCRHQDTLTSIDFSTTAPVDPPSALGILDASAPERGMLTVASAYGLCSGTVTAVWVDVELIPDPTSVPWADALEYETRVDGAQWSPSESLPVSPPPGSSWVGRGRDRIYAICETDDPGVHPGVDEGHHTVELRAGLPGDGRTLVSDEIQIELRCSASGPDGGLADGGLADGGFADGGLADGSFADGDAAVPPTDAGGTPMGDASTGDAGDSPTDGGRSVRDAGNGGDGAVLPPGGGSAGGCGCTVPGGLGPSAPPTVLLGLVALVLVARRRRGFRGAGVALRDARPLA